MNFESEILHKLRTNGGSPIQADILRQNFIELLKDRIDEDIVRKKFMGAILNLLRKGKIRPMSLIDGKSHIELK